MFISRAKTQDITALQLSRGWARKLQARFALKLRVGSEVRVGPKEVVPTELIEAKQRDLQRECAELQVPDELKLNSDEMGTQLQPDLGSSTCYTCLHVS